MPKQTVEATDTLNTGRTKINDNFTEVYTDIAGKAATTHTHIIANVTSLQASLDGKAAVAHNHAISDVTNLQTSLDAKSAASAVLGVVLHGATGTTARPTGFAQILWIGSADPANRATNDLWLGTTLQYWNGTAWAAT